MSSQEIGAATAIGMRGEGPPGAVTVLAEDCGGISDEDIARLRTAVSQLTEVSLAARLVDIIGRPIEAAIDDLPDDTRKWIVNIVATSLQRAQSVAGMTIPASESTDSWDWFHKLVVGATGAIGGAVGMAGLTVELPLSVTIMLRSITDIARSLGEDLATTEATDECLKVFAFGSPGTTTDDASETGYWMVRGALATVVEAHTADLGARLLAAVAERFGVAVSGKVAAQIVPMIGGIAGATINCIFIHHFQSVARGHFTVRALERKYGSQVVRRCFERILANMKSKGSDQRE